MVEKFTAILRHLTRSCGWVLDLIYGFRLW